MAKKLTSLLMNNMVIDYDCKYCQDTMKEAEKSFKEDKPFTILFNPDKNAAGVVTHWHLEIIYRNNDNNNH